VTIIYGDRIGQFRVVANAPRMLMWLMSGNVLSSKTEGH